MHAILRRFFVTMLMALVTATLFLRTNLHPDSVESGNLYFSVIFFSLISLMFDGFAEETLTVRCQPACMFTTCMHAWNNVK